MLALRPLPIALSLLALTATAAVADTTPTPVPGETRPVVLVGNNWEGTTDVVDPFTLKRLDRIDVIPDRAEREAEIMMNPDRLGFFLAVREEVGEGHDQFNDDVFSSHDGRTIFVSRPSFADVVAIDLATKKIVWRTPVGGYRADHMAISADGTKLLVSASTANVVDQVDTTTGAITGQWASGDSPHENNYSADGRLIFHAAIGRVYLAADTPEGDRTAKGKRVFQIVDAHSLEVLKEIDMGQKLAEAGFPDMSSAVRPMALAPDGRYLYFQVSFFHGFVEYDLQTDRVLRIAELPISAEAQKLSREDYLLDSAHHGLAINPGGTKLCVAGTMSNYGAIVARKSFKAWVRPGINKPYWATNSADGRYCYISGSGDDALFVLSYRTKRILAKIPVGDHPQRVRNGVARIDIYPGGESAVPFRLAVRTTRTPVCRATGAGAPALSACLVRVRRGGRILAIGERMAPNRRRIAVRLTTTRAGLAAVRSGTVRATLVARATDAVGRTRIVRRPFTLRG